MERFIASIEIFLTYSPSELKHLSCRGTNFCILCRKSLPHGIGTTVTLISASLSFCKRWRWSDRNFLNCKKTWKSLGARSGLQGEWLNTSNWTTARDVLTVEPYVAIDLALLTMNFDRRYGLCIQKLYRRPHFIVGGCWNNSLHLQPLQRCYCENFGSPASACIMRRHYSITHTQSLHAISSLLVVGRVENLLCGRFS